MTGRYGRRCSPPACVWALHAAQDWVWELPVGDRVAIRRGRDRPGAAPGCTRDAPDLPAAAGARHRRARRARAGVTPILNALADARLRDSVAAFKLGDCDTRDRPGARLPPPPSAPGPSPTRCSAFCDVRLGKPALADRMIRNAIDRDPDNWVYHYGLRAGARGQRRGPARGDRRGPPPQPARAARDRGGGGLHLDGQPPEMEKAGPEGPPSDPVSWDTAQPVLSPPARERSIPPATRKHDTHDQEGNREEAGERELAPAASWRPAAPPARRSHRRRGRCPGRRD